MAHDARSVAERTAALERVVQALQRAERKHHKERKHKARQSHKHRRRKDKEPRKRKRENKHKSNSGSVETGGRHHRHDAKRSKLRRTSRKHPDYESGEQRLPLDRCERERDREQEGGKNHGERKTMRSAEISSSDLSSSSECEVQPS